MNKTIKTIPIAVAACLALAGTAFAAGRLTASDEAKKLSESSPDAAMYTIDQDISLGDDYLTDNKIEDLEKQIESYENQIKALRRGAGISEEVSFEDCLNKADELQYTLFSLRADLVEYELAQADNALYAEYADALTSEKLRDDAYSVYDRLKKYEYDKEYLSYQKAYSSLMAEKIRVEQAKFDEGFSMQVDVDTLTAEKASVDAQIAETQADISYAEKYFSVTYDEALAQYDADAFTLPDREQTEKDFADAYCFTSYKQRQAQNITDANTKFIALIKEIDEFIASEDSDHKPDADLVERLTKLKDDITSKVSLQEKQAQKHKLEAESYKRDQSLYIERLYSQADVLDKKIAACDKEIAAAKENIRIKTELYDSGMILEYELTEAKVTLKKLDAERTQLVCDRDRVLYCLDNRVYRG